MWLPEREKFSIADFNLDKWHKSLYEMCARMKICTKMCVWSTVCTYVVIPGTHSIRLYLIYWYSHSSAKSRACVSHRSLDKGRTFCGLETLSRDDTVRSRWLCCTHSSWDSIAKWCGALYMYGSPHIFRRINLSIASRHALPYWLHPHTKAGDSSKVVLHWPRLRDCIEETTCTCLSGSTCQHVQVGLTCVG